jgi:hypothetical protein
MNPITTDQVHRQLKAMTAGKEYVKIEDLASALSAPIAIIASHLHILEMFHHVTINTANNSVKVADAG